jgi:hypothetical protein
MVWLIAFAVLAGAWFTASLATFLVTRSMVRRDAAESASALMSDAMERLEPTMADVPGIARGVPLNGPTPESRAIYRKVILGELRRSADCDCEGCRDFWIDHGQEIQTLAEEASAKAIEAAKKAQAVN